jgi:hypothetical protein
MQSVSHLSPIAHAKPTRAVAPAVRFGESPIKVADELIQREQKAMAPKTQGFARRMAVPTAWVVGGALLAFGTAGILHFIGFPLMAWGAYQAVKKWKG